MKLSALKAPVSKLALRRCGALTCSLLAVAVIAPSLLVASAAATVPLSSVYLVAGSGSVTDASGQVWGSDSTDAVGGRISVTTHAIAGTTTPGLYQSERVGVSGYRIPVVNGTYTVTLNMADTYWTKAQQRVFDVTAEGKLIVSRVDIVAAVGQFHADQATFIVTVADGVLDLGFLSYLDQATIGSLSVLATGVTTPTTPTTPVTTPTTSVTTPTVPVATSTVPVATSPTTPTTPTVATTPVTTPPTTPTSSPVTSVGGPVVSPESFGAKGDGVTDDTAALQKTFDSAPAGTTVLLGAGKVYAHSAVLHLRSAGAHLTGPGMLLATNEAASSVWIEADNVLVDGGVVFRTLSTKRWGAWEQMGIRLDGHTGITLRNVTVDGSAAAGIYVGNHSTAFTLDHVTVQNTRADGIHMTGGASNGHVIAPTVINSGDDGVAVVSYSADGAPCADITVTSPRVLGTGWGRGLSVVGGTNITESNIDVENSDAAAVYIAAEGSPWFTAAPNNVTVTGGTITGANHDITVDHGAVLILAAETGPTPATITVTDLTIINTRPTASRDLGVITYGTPPTGILFANITITGGPTHAYQGNTPQSSYQTRTITQDNQPLPNQG